MVLPNSFVNANAVHPREERDRTNDAAQVLVNLALSQPGTILSDVTSLTSSPSEELAHPQSISASIYHLSTTLSNRVHQGANAVQAFSNKAQDNDNTRTDKIYNASDVDSSGVCSRTSSSSSYSNGIVSNYASQSPDQNLAPPPRKRAQTRFTPTTSPKLDVPTFEHHVRPPTPEPGLDPSSEPEYRSTNLQKPITGKGSIIGDRLDDKIMAADRKWRSDNHDNPPPPRARKTKKEASTVQEENEAPPARKKKRAAPKAKVEKEHETDMASPGGSERSESSTSTTPPTEEEQGGRPKRARKSTRKVEESYGGVIA